MTRNLILICFVLTACKLFHPFGCHQRGKLLLSDGWLATGVVGTKYHEEIVMASGLCCLELKEGSEPVPDGLKLLKQDQLFMLEGIPEKTGTFSIQLIGTEYGTQCPGRSDEFIITFIIKNPD